MSCSSTNSHQFRQLRPMPWLQAFRASAVWKHRAQKTPRADAIADVVNPSGGQPIRERGWVQVDLAAVTLDQKPDNTADSDVRDSSPGSAAVTGAFTSCLPSTAIPRGSVRRFGFDGCLDLRVRK
jgi:hypothetical protein